MRDLELRTIAWAEARDIIKHSSADVQLLKAVSEMGELADATIKCDREEIIDSVGDVLVVLAIYCKLQNTNMQYCWEEALKIIEPRKGKLMPNGVFVKSQS